MSDLRVGQLSGVHIPPRVRLSPIFGSTVAKFTHSLRHMDLRCGEPARSGTITTNEPRFSVDGGRWQGCDALYRIPVRPDKLGQNRVIEVEDALLEPAPEQQVEVRSRTQRVCGRPGTRPGRCTMQNKLSPYRSRPQPIVRMLRRLRAGFTVKLSQSLAERGKTLRSLRLTVGQTRATGSTGRKSQGSAY